MKGFCWLVDTAQLCMCIEYPSALLFRVITPFICHRRVSLSYLGSLLWTLRAAVSLFRTSFWKNRPGDPCSSSLWMNRAGAPRCQCAARWVTPMGGEGVKGSLSDWGGSQLLGLGMLVSGGYVGLWWKCTKVLIRSLEDSGRDR